MGKQRIAVIGAGPMGLAVAYQLVKDGHQPVVYDVDDRIGGQAASFDFGGLEIERYYHFHCTSDVDFFAVLDEMGLSHKLHWVKAKMGFYYLGKVNPWGNPIALFKFKGLGLLGKLRYGLHAFVCIKRKNWKGLDSLEASAWVKRWVGKKAYDVLWRKLLEFKFYDFADKLSAAWIWSRIRRIGLSRYNLMNEKLGYLEGGSSTLLNAMRKYIEANGGEFRLQNAVRKIVLANGSVEAVESKEGVEKYAKVISTIPLPFVSKVIPDLPAAYLEKISRFDNIAVVCVIAKLKKAVSDCFWMNVNDDSMAIPGLVEYSNLRPLDHHVVYIPFYIPAEHPKYQNSDQEFQDEVKGYLQKINPELSDNDFVEIRASRYRHAQPICRPRHLDGLPDWRQPAKGLWVADTSYYYPEDRGISESFAFGRMMAKEAVR